MNKLLLIFSSIFLLCSCGEQYNIAGNSSVASLDGRMLYLRISPDGTTRTIETTSLCLDSCEVVHGRFEFFGDVDSTMMAMLYTGKECVMPLVLENGKLDIQVDNIAPHVTGGKLNERLYSFFKKRNRLDNEIWELENKVMRMMREGYSPAEIQKKVGKRAEELNEKAQEMETRFVKENYDNVLGPGFFMLLCRQYPSPIMTEQISKIVKGAPAHFLNDPFVSHYLQQARLRSEAEKNNGNVLEMTIPEHNGSTVIKVNCP